MSQSIESAAVVAAMTLAAAAWVATRDAAPGREAYVHKAFDGALSKAGLSLTSEGRDAFEGARLDARATFTAPEWTRDASGDAIMRAFLGALSARAPKGLGALCERKAAPVKGKAAPGDVKAAGAMFAAFTGAPAARPRPAKAAPAAPKAAPAPEVK